LGLRLAARGVVLPWWADLASHIRYSELLSTVTEGEDYDYPVSWRYPREIRQTHQSSRPVSERIAERMKSWPGECYALTRAASQLGTNVGHVEPATRDGRAVGLGAEVGRLAGPLGGRGPPTEDRHSGGHDVTSLF
jgi:hypothetical protein